MRLKHLIRGFISVVAVAFMFTGCAVGRVKVSDPTDLGKFVDDSAESHCATESGAGSLWTSCGNGSNYFRDPKARFINDVITIRVSETTSAVASADAKNTRATSATAGINNLFGIEKAIKKLPTMVDGKSDSSFEGKGSTSRATTLETNLTARVTKVLSNGNLVVEGKREVRVNNENQMVYLTGVVRPEDISSSNVVLSSAVAQMSVHVQGRGAVSQPIKAGWLYRILTSVLPF
jgi:flagellar L-ring protein FlgH